MVKAIPQQPAFFTASQASEMLPLVRRIVEDWMELSTTVIAQQAQLEGLTTLHHTMGVKAYAEELAEVEQSLRAERDQLEDCCEELESLGVEPHSPADGSVDFPAMLQGREIRLCWQVGEESVRHWHEVGQPASQRQPIRPPQRISS